MNYVKILFCKIEDFPEELDFKERNKIPSIMGGYGGTKKGEPFIRVYVDVITKVFKGDEEKICSMIQQVILHELCHIAGLEDESETIKATEFLISQTGMEDLITSHALSDNFV